ncbi:murein hydrolase activator EnvC family protein [Pseudomonas sp.]|jgi:murein hydrolase activator|uniref:murein hydrolase activator EnvC family protein n=1 Tax=Pseudomonas sp. TaxID=306 RepID=UPI00272BEDA5|nr:peptidoglycan DD-metalloendopeptidase family protein [Pseudomonas sp.]
MARANGWRLRRVLGGSLLVLALGGSVLVAVPAAAQDSREAKAELKQTEAEIAKLKKMLGTLQQDMSELETQLKKSESEIGRLRRESQELEKQIRDGETRLQEMHSQAEGLHAALEAQQEQIARQVRSAYMAGQQDYLKLMLNQDDPARVARMMRYYEYVSRARSEEITEYRNTIEQIRQASVDIVREQNRLQDNREQLAGQRRAIEAQQANRNQLLAGLRGERRTQEQQLKARESERAELAKLIKSLDEAITSIPTPAGNLPFVQAKGKMPLPLKGTIEARFGSQRGGDSRLKWDGLLISASEGAGVHAIHGGRVVFADWLRGSGLLLILDHGGGYLSLYGHNQTLLREVGAWVQPGEAVATVGSSGGLGSPSLYFSIRHQGRPLDPLAWCMLPG